MIRAEAEYNYQLLKARRETYNLPRAERKKKLKAIDREYKPEFSFLGISTRFGHYIHTKKPANYSIDELEAFIYGMAEGKNIRIE
ncbi:hypothetical protein [Roseofilum casamattae]|uniref:Uncharacterized protein n=1 Tax=Roseofilum casamattae BLCC-M143 TaxID=3022442 RepID=A0ABT7BRG6_9CYAN|nr:hypothetical protein [Roseofilum casamattae]MDJ1181784.1 hypothetical protein [Roseofilum casamattae BLCC-M143]